MVETPRSTTDLHKIFADDMHRCYVEELEKLKLDEVRANIYMNSGYSGDVWPEDFDTDWEASDEELVE